MRKTYNRATGKHQKRTKRTHDAVKWYGEALSKHSVNKQTAKKRKKQTKK